MTASEERPTGMYIQYGCGFSSPEGWRNFDSSPTLRIERLPLVGKLACKFFLRNHTPFPARVEYGDICNGLPVEAGLAQGVYASHVLEHLALSDFRRALANTYRLLKSGGVFRLIVPDLRSRCEIYLSELQKENNESSSLFMRLAHLGLETRPSTILSRIRQSLGGSAHLWMWDELSMKKELIDAGFIDVRRCQFGDSGDAHFSSVEDRGRFIDEKWDITELAMHCVRP